MTMNAEITKQIQIENVGYGRRQQNAGTTKVRGGDGEQLHTLLTRKQGATLSQLRTGHCALNQYLHRFSITEDPHCECGNGIEMVKHYLLDCRTHEESRKELREKVGWRNMRVQKLLSNPKVVKNTMEFVDKTGRFRK
jgi:hypothetical protein